MDRSLADKWARFGDRRDEGANDSDIATAYGEQVERDGPPEAEAAFRVGRERVVESDGPGGLRVPGRLDRAITEASAQILTARGFRASADQPGEPPENVREDVPEPEQSTTWWRGHVDGASERADDSTELEPFNPEHARQVPDRSDTKTGGMLVDESGEQVWTEARWSGYEGPAQEIGGWDALGLPRDLWTVSHVEAHAAAEMRRLGLESATLYVNNVPCQLRYGCDKMLPYMLPEGARLTVYGPDGFSKVYEGLADR